MVLTDQYIREAAAFLGVPSTDVNIINITKEVCKECEGNSCSLLPMNGSFPFLVVVLNNATIHMPVQCHLLEGLEELIRKRADTIYLLVRKRDGIGKVKTWIKTRCMRHEKFRATENLEVIFPSSCPSALMYYYCRLNSKNFIWQILLNIVIMLRLEFVLYMFMAPITVFCLKRD